MRFTPAERFDSRTQQGFGAWGSANRGGHDHACRPGR
jgi:hypothetical protein